MMYDPRADPEGLLRGAIWRARAYNGVSGRSPQRSPGAEPLVRGGKAPPEAESFLTFGHQTEIITFVFFCYILQTQDA